MLACYKEILKENSFPWQTSLLGFLESFLVIHASSSLLLDTGDDNPDDTYSLRGGACSLYYHLSFHTFCKCFVSVNNIFYWSEYIVLNHCPCFNIVCMRKYVTLS